MPAAMDRRTILTAIPASLLLSACVPSARLLKGDWQRFAATGGARVDHRLWDEFLGTYVQPGDDGITRVAYAAAARVDAQMLRPYLDALQAVDPATLGRDEQMAYWINLYNAATVDLILQSPTVESIRSIGTLSLGPWDRKILTVNGMQLSLNAIEHGILRPIWRDVRIHYAVNCASIGCPNLATTSYSGDRLSAMLDAAATSYINHPRGFARVDGRLIASSIYNWYGVDWGSTTEILAHARRYANSATLAMLADATTIDGYAYDWSLNAS